MSVILSVVSTHTHARTHARTYARTHARTHTHTHTHTCTQHTHTHTHTHTLAHRVSVDAVEEELGEWRKEVDQLREMVSQSNEMQLGEDFVSQLDQFLPVSKSPTPYLFLAHSLLRALSLSLFNSLFCLSLYL